MQVHGEKLGECQGSRLSPATTRGFPYHSIGLIVTDPSCDARIRIRPFSRKDTAEGTNHDHGRAPAGRSPPPHPWPKLRTRGDRARRPRGLPARRSRAPGARDRPRSALRRVRRLHLSALLGLLCGVFLLGLRLPDVQPRGLLVRVLCGLVRELHVRRLHLPHLRTRSVINASARPHTAQPNSTRRRPPGDLGHGTNPIVSALSSPRHWPNQGVFARRLSFLRARPGQTDVPGRMRL
ncbi:hypothetical protein KIPE111705_39755 [Kibdelosporangium persicum]